ncbi:MAG TPA: hypothetical protein VF265_03930 [Nevskiaceae bacterium]
MADKGEGAQGSIEDVIPLSRTGVVIVNMLERAKRRAKKAERALPIDQLQQLSAAILAVRTASGVLVAEDTFRDELTLAVSDALPDAAGIDDAKAVVDEALKRWPSVMLGSWRYFVWASRFPDDGPLQKLSVSDFNYSILAETPHGFV